MTVAVFATALIERFDLLLGLFLGDAVQFLQFAGQHFAVALDLLELVVGQLAPLLAYLAFQLFPIAFYLVPVHGELLVWIGRIENRMAIDLVPIIGNVDRLGSRGKDELCVSMR